MKKFTIKDFISYNNPCFSCKSKVNFYFVIDDKDFSKSKSPSHLSPIVSNEFISVDLRRNYSHSLTLNIHNKTNKFSANNKHELEHFLRDHNINITLSCPKCRTAISSKMLIFDSKIYYVKPTEVLYEDIVIEDEDKTYRLGTHVDSNITQILVYFNNATNLNTFSLKIPALPLFKFKNRINVIKKIKTYMIFS